MEGTAILLTTTIKIEGKHEYQKFCKVIRALAFAFTASLVLGPFYSLNTTAIIAHAQSQQVKVNCMNIQNTGDIFLARYNLQSHQLESIQVGTCRPDNASFVFDWKPAYTKAWGIQFDPLDQFNRTEFINELRKAAQR